MKALLALLCVLPLSSAFAGRDKSIPLPHTIPAHDRPGDEVQVPLYRDPPPDMDPRDAPSKKEDDEAKRGIITIGGEEEEPKELAVTIDMAPASAPESRRTKPTVEEIQAARLAVESNNRTKLDALFDQRLAVAALADVAGTMELERHEQVARAIKLARSRMLEDIPRHERAGVDPAAKQWVHDGLYKQLASRKDLTIDAAIAVVEDALGLAESSDVRNDPPELARKMLAMVFARMSANSTALVDAVVARTAKHPLSELVADGLRRSRQRKP